MKNQGYLLQRFYKNIRFGFGENACWTWLGGMSMKTGRGQFWFEGCTISSPVMSYIIAFGYIPDGLFVLHKCDNPSCVNPNHLFLGTHLDNMKDMSQKGRSPVKSGERAFASKLTNIEAKQIRKLYASKEYSQKELAIIFNVHPTTISYIILNKTFVGV